MNKQILTLKNFKYLKSLNLRHLRSFTQLLLVALAVGSQQFCSRSCSKLEERGCARAAADANEKGLSFKSKQRALKARLGLVFPAFVSARSVEAELPGGQGVEF